MTKIEWTNETWNPTRGCSMVSAGCEHCYAMGQAHRFSGPGGPYEGLTKLVKGKGPRWTGKVVCVPEMLEKPLRWRKPRRIFVNSMSDLFHEAVSFEFVERVFAVMALTPRHTFQVLTKRPERMQRYFTERYFVGRVKPPPWPLPNVWLGVSVEDQKTADERIPHLLQTPAAVRWLSLEPLLDSVNLEMVPDFREGWSGCLNTLTGEWWPAVGNLEEEIAGVEQRGGLDWIVIGGESGPRARPMHPDWVRSIRDQCDFEGVPFFFKQWGGVHKKAAGRELDGRTWEEYPR